MHEKNEADCVQMFQKLLRSMTWRAWQSSLQGVWWSRWSRERWVRGYKKKWTARMCDVTAFWWLSRWSPGMLIVPAEAIHLGWVDYNKTS